MGQYIVEDAKSGKKTLLYRNDRDVRIHSAYDPEKEASRAVALFKKGRASFIVVCGLGLGYHVKLLEQKFADTTILVLERDKDVVRIARSLDPDITTYAIVITQGSDLASIVESLDMSKFRGMARYVHNPSYLIDKEYYENATADIGHHITSKISDLLTRFEFESLWTQNIFMNLPSLTKATPVQTLFGRFKGYPGIIVSAGPSLRKNMDTLSSLRDRALIVCVDTAAKVLDKKGISPHLIMTLDAQKHSIRHFLGLSNHAPALVADLVSSPMVIRLYRGNIIASSTSKYYTDKNGALKRETTPVMDWIEQYVPSIGDIQSGGSVATSAFDLLLNLGCNPIILVGQDLAYTGREIHTSGTHHNDDWFPTVNRLSSIDTINQKIIRKRKIKIIPAVGGGTVISDFVFDLYRGWFEDSAQKVPLTVINATEGGGRIKYTNEETLLSLAQRLPIHKQTPEALLHQAMSGAKPIETIALQSAIAQTIDRIRDTLTKALSLPQENNDAIDSLAEQIEQSDLKMLYAPVLRKTTLYLTRKKLDPEKRLPLLKKELISASRTLITVLEKSLAMMER